MLTPTQGQVFVSAKFQRVGSTHGANKLVVTNVHLPTENSFSPGEKTLRDGTKFPSAYAQSTAYQRELAKRIARNTGSNACAAVCASPSVETPTVPMMITGDFNAVYQKTSKTAAENAIQTGPYALINYTGYKFQGPDYTKPAKDTPELAAWGTNLPNETIMGDGVVIDHALLKVPADTLKVRSYSVTSMRLNTSSVDTNLKDYLASDHRMIVAQYQLQYVS
ncbi:hypothetical protein G7066_13385 [Leucobacter coleopterorum]|uniref:Endonuclease/Exonuclease/phosphatase family protein n=1 Tax=Leucobacter coleopterorum TaxID=2714933 RepID=A0ABX6JYB6_9MICO|nr:hypothetical protein [Leucobacter coleopterorum]QIM19315.1 hypothetical protein G7066_13385 [Leucobacter coleopterorum]